MDRYTAIFGLTPSERAALDEAIRITNAREHITPDDCQNCGGNGCDECRPPLPDRSKARPR